MDEKGVPVRSVTAAEAPQALGWLAMLAGLDMEASSARTRPPPACWPTTHR